MLRPAPSADPHTGRTLGPFRHVPSYFDLLHLDDWDEPLTTARPVFHVRRFHLTARQRQRRIEQLNYKIARDLADAKWEEQQAREDAQTEVFLANARTALRKAAESEAKEIIQASVDAAVAVSRYERILFHRLRNGKGFRQRP